ncbi:PREDICTED: GRIP1-associated protein 1-like [Amphimedon queenslandica]|uniref:GRIP1-associated protein 1 n=1 Tax=Amphimedon queenslandica TaxID=400682 RepID=A0A1X7UWN9_AMPQE|nr:PREDICTED: GRIP1-associated protein 1-like [Amphimedon queenslandica]|eukprot:XP_019851975.1 PREDICTED: GRIP1-associated protein 1-like [Amphimedon queenslandica]
MAADSSSDPAQISIDQEEFTRLQTQLIELRTKNYELKEEQSKKDAEYKQLLSSNQQLNKELEKANKSIQRSKKAKEYQLLSEENEVLQKRLHTQEEDFKLQNTTLMNELAKVCEEKEVLKKGGGAGGVASGDRGSSQELTHLQAENKALQKSLQTLQEQLQSAGREGEQTEGEEPSTIKGEEDDRVQPAQAPPVAINLKLATLEEENKILQEQLSAMEEKGRREKEELKTQIDRLEEKTRKKQEILVQVQNEKEKILSENKLSYDNMCQEKEREMESLHQEIKQLQEEDENRRQESESSADLAQQISSLKNEKEELLKKYRHLQEHQEALTNERDSNKVILEELSTELQQSKKELGEMKRKYSDMELELKSSQEANDSLADQLLTAREDRIKLGETISTIEKLADKRKSLLDEMAIKEHETATENKKKENDLIDKYKGEIESLQSQLDEERDKVKHLNSSVDELADLKRRIKSMENMKETYEQQLKEAQESFSKEKGELELKLSELDGEYKERLTGLETEAEEERKKATELKEKITELELELDEKTQEINITGKKSSNLIKDLKRQLQAAQKREERLQDSLSSSSPHIEVSTPIRQDSRHSRESSLSSVRGIGATGGAEQTQQFNEVDSSNKDDVQTLLDKIASLQQENWQLEEKLNHLESTSSSLAEDVIQKSTIIQNYFMENKADHSATTSSSQSTSHAKMSPLRLMQWAKTPAKEDTMAEVNRKMQRALEEALMKNIHLQQNVDMLSTQLQKEEKDENT